MKTLRKSLLTLATLLCSIANAYCFEMDGVYYNVTSSEDLTVEVTNNEYKYTGEIIIPESVTYKSKTYSVTSIGAFAFYECSELTSVTIPNSVTIIKNAAFKGCI